jgi:hypothetical protein
MPRILGTSFLIVGVVVLAAGVAAIVFAEVDSGDIESETFSDDDEDRQQRNDQIRTGGWIAAIVGGVLALFGIVALTAGRR